jgi:hypothetical protein
MQPDGTMTGKQERFDAVSLGLFASRLESVCDEMGAILRNAAFSPNIRDRLDFSCAIFDAGGELCAQAAHIPVHLGSMAYAMRDIVRRMAWSPGDQVILNDPFLGGTHLPDVTLVAPLFAGDELLGFVANRAHHADIGASTPGSMPVSSTLEEEGLVIEPVHLVRGGRRQEAIWRSILNATGNPRVTEGDLSAQLSANGAGVRRLGVLVQGQGVKGYLQGLVALNDYAERLAGEAAFQRWTQWVFFSQWRELASFAHDLGVGIVGDMPIFVAHDSADVWAHPELFQLDDDLNPVAVAGVPPDYFSPTGQLWGNPLYDWEALRRTGFAWWVRRLRHALKLADLVRVDHFRGFEAYWAVPAGAATAEAGHWEKAPGAELFERLVEELGSVPIIAEDLGLITPEVEALRDRFGLPGMKVLQFAFTGEDNPFLPHNYPESGNCVVYTGTHDNDTTRGWCESAPAAELDFMRRYLERRGIAFAGCKDAPWALIELALQSRCRMAVFPLQDPLELGSQARMNYPSRAQGNWSWRYPAAGLTPALARRLRELAERYDRVRRG